MTLVIDASGRLRLTDQGAKSMTAVVGLVVRICHAVEKVQSLGRHDPPQDDCLRNFVCRFTVRQVREAQEYKPTLKCGFVVSRNKRSRKDGLAAFASTPATSC
jgi:hypothetical protein